MKTSQITYEDTSAANGYPRLKQLDTHFCDVISLGNVIFHPSITGYIQKFWKHPKWFFDRVPVTIPIYIYIWTQDTITFFIELINW